MEEQNKINKDTPRVEANNLGVDNLTYTETMFLNLELKMRLRRLMTMTKMRRRISYLMELIAMLRS